jgi:polyisoprenoid-binding protein YceI
MHATRPYPASRRWLPAALLLAALLPAMSCATAARTAAEADPPRAVAIDDATTGAGAALPAWEVDPVHTRVLVAIDHAGFSRALGTVSGTTGRLAMAPGTWDGASVEVEVPLARLDFGDEAWNRAVLARGLLDVERHPVARFHSTRVEPIDADHARIHGTLALHGVEQPVVLEARRNGERRHPMPPFRRTAGFSATTVLERADFGVDAWPSVIGGTVELTIELEATRTRD